MGERRARWGYGYQDKVATERILSLLRKDLREGTVGFEGVRLADLAAGRVDDFVLVCSASVEGNSIKWSREAAPLTWGDLVGASGLLRELAEGYQRLCRAWRGRTVSVRLQSNRPASVEKHHAQLIQTISVAEFLAKYWPVGPVEGNSPEATDAWRKIADHVGLTGTLLSAFVSSCHLSLGRPEPPGNARDSLDWRHYKQQFDSLHKAIATWLTNTPDGEFIDREFLLEAIGVRASRSGLIQRFPEPEIPYEKNHAAADRLKELIEATPGGYLAVVGSAGIGKSTLVQDVLTDSAYPFFVPYYAFLPSTDGNRDRGEALTFFQDVIGRLDRFSADRLSLGISDVEQGRGTLRCHMSKANERYVLQGHKTILLVDGLDHVTREVNLQRSMIHELPPPEEVPAGFVILLSGQPQAFIPGTIPVQVATAVENHAGRLEVFGLSRQEVHALISRVSKSTTAAERDALYSSCLGNPLILTYLLAQFERTVETTVDEAIGFAGHYTGGPIDQYYRERLSVPLQESVNRRLLGLLCRAAPTIPVAWLQGWPEKGEIEDLYKRVLAPFLRVDDGAVQFIHDSLIAFLKSETRSRLPGSDAIADERAFHSALADRSNGRPCSDPVGRARIVHLLRAERHTDLLEQLSSNWVREAMHTFLPYAHIHPLLLCGFHAAWATSSWGHVMRLILLDFELEQGTSRTESGTLAETLLGNDETNLALSHVRSAGRLLVDDKVALRFAGVLWRYANRHDRPELKMAARTLYLQAKPVSMIYQAEPLDSARPDHQDLLSIWCDAAPLFEHPSVVVQEIQKLTFPAAVGQGADATSLRATLLFHALDTAIDVGLDATESRAFLTAIEALQIPTWRFVALLRLAESVPSSVPFAIVQSAHDGAQTDADIELAYAWFLFRLARSTEATEVVRRLHHIRFQPYHETHSWGFSDISYTVRLRWLQELLGMPEGALPGVKDDGEEASARVERAARQIGHLRAMAARGTIVAQRDVILRSLLLFHNQSVSFATIGPRHGYIIETSKDAIYKEVAGLAKAMGGETISVLRDMFRELVSGPAGGQFTAHHHRQFAKFFFQQGVMSREQAIELGLSSTADATDDEPTQRQEACLEIATFLHMVGDQAASRNWIRRASEVSAGAGGYKDYHMAHVAEWLVRSVDRAEPGTLEILDRLARAVEIAGGEGGSDGAAEELQLLVRLDPARASRLAVEWIDREVLNVSSVLEALIVGGARAGAEPDLLTATFCELHSLIAPDDISAPALAVLRAYPREHKREIALRLMSSVRTNAAPSRRVGVARALEDALREEGLGELPLACGLKTGWDDSSRKSSLYGLKTGEAETISRVAARLGDSEHPEAWNPNPSENMEFDWWSAIEKSRVKSLMHLDSLVAMFPPPDYRGAALLARRAECAVEMGDWDTARKLTELAISRSKDGSWHLWIDGAAKRTAFRVLKRVDHAEGVARAREQFSKDLSAGKRSSSFLLSDIGDILDLLEVPWPSESVRVAVNDYLEQVLAANRQVVAYESFNEPAPSWSADQALCRFIAHLVAFPVIDVAVAARRVLAQYFAADGSGLIWVMSDEAGLEPVELEHILSAMHVGSRSNVAAVGRLRSWIEGLNVSESLAVRSIARRICEEQGWQWEEIRTRPAQPVILLPGIRDRDREAEMLLGSDVATAWGLHQKIFATLERAGLDARELRSEFERTYLVIEKDYQWADDERLKRWMKLVLARFWLNPVAIVGREAAMRVFGKRSLSGQAPPGAEAAYDYFYPIYDPHLELCQPTERPVELTAMEWRISDDAGAAWLSGAHADSWSDYPELIQGLHVIGERTWFIRPEWVWPREERHRGVVMGPLDSMAERLALESKRELTYEAYLKGLAQNAEQLIVVNCEQQLVGPAYRWAAINSEVARALCWSPSDKEPFCWKDASGSTTVKSVYWKDGWIWLEPPHFESLGEGWLVLATCEAVEAIRRLAPMAELHLWVERHSHGEDPYHGKWHLSKSL
jgi:hypothetical protein